MSTQETFVTLVSSTLEIAPAIVKDDLKYNSIPQWDSLGHMQLVAALEDEFDIMLDTDDIIGMSSIAIAKDILRKYDVKI